MATSIAADTCSADALAAMGTVARRAATSAITAPSGPRRTVTLSISNNRSRLRSNPTTGNSTAVVEESAIAPTATGTVDQRMDANAIRVTTWFHQKNLPRMDFTTVEDTCRRSAHVAMEIAVRLLGTSAIDVPSSRISTVTP